jgi:hypothetical protein
MVRRVLSRRLQMTAAMIREACRIVDELELVAADIVTLIEIGSEGAILKVNPFATKTPRAQRWLIARNGESRRE